MTDGHMLSRTGLMGNFGLSLESKLIHKFPIGYPEPIYGSIASPGKNGLAVKGKNDTSKTVGVIINFIPQHTPLFDINKYQPGSMVFFPGTCDKPAIVGNSKIYQLYVAGFISYAGYFRCFFSFEINIQDLIICPVF